MWMVSILMKTCKMEPQNNDSYLYLNKVENTGAGHQTAGKIDKVVFLGTPEFAVPTLELLAQTEYKPLLVVTQPDTKQGRNMRLTAPPVKQKAIEFGIETMQPESVNEEYVVDRIAYLSPDIIVTVAYGGILKKRLLQTPKYGCINLHPSLLPKYRGPSPINYTLFNDERKTGNTVFRMVRKMDSGPILYQSTMDVLKEDNATTLSEKLAAQGANDVLYVLNNLIKGKVKEKQQDESQATYTKKIAKEDALINWQKDSRYICSRIKGLAEDPGAFTFLRGQRMKILRAEELNQDSVEPAGTIVAAGDLTAYNRKIEKKGIIVASGDKDILITELQPAGKRAMQAFEFQLGAKIQPFEKLKDEH